MTPARPTVDVAGLAELLAAHRSSSPWSAATTGVQGGDHWYVVAEGEAVAWIAANDGRNEEQREPLAALIVAAVNALPDLLAHLAAVTAERDEARAALVGARDDIKARIVTFRDLSADGQYMNALSDAWGLVANRVRAALDHAPATEGGEG